MDKQANIIQANPIGKMDTPDYIYEFRAGEYTINAAVEKLFQECGIDSYLIDVCKIATSLGFKLFQADLKKEQISGVMFH